MIKWTELFITLSPKKEKIKGEKTQMVLEKQHLRCNKKNKTSARIHGTNTKEIDTCEKDIKLFK